MNKLYDTGKNIYVFDDEKACGMKPKTAEEEVIAVAQPEKIKAVPAPSSRLATMLQSAFKFISPAEELSIETDAYDDHLIPLEDEEDAVDTRLSDAANLLDNLSQDLGMDHEEGKTPLILAAFKSRFLG